MFTIYCILISIFFHTFLAHTFFHRSYSTSPSSFTLQIPHVSQHGCMYVCGQNMSELVSLGTSPQLLSDFRSDPMLLPLLCRWAGVAWDSLESDQSEPFVAVVTSCDFFVVSTSCTFLCLALWIVAMKKRQTFRVKLKDCVFPFCFIPDWLWQEYH